MNTLFLKILVLALFFTASLIYANNSESNYDLSDRSEDCRKFINELPPAVEWDFLSVPEAYTSPEGKKIKVFYYVKKSDLVGANTIIFYNGGPGESSHGMLELFGKNEQAKKLNIIFMDQRGTGCSDAFPKLDLSSEANAKMSISRIQHYGARSIVKDSEVLRKRLFGSKKWRIFGQSFGGIVVHHYVSMFPEAIDRAYAHGSSLMESELKWITQRLKSQKRVSDLYFKKYPDDKKLVSDIKSIIPSTLCMEKKDRKICGEALFDGFIFLLGFPELTLVQDGEEITCWELLHDLLLYYAEWKEKINSNPEEQEIFNKAFLDYIADYTGLYINDDSFAAAVVGEIESIEPSEPKCLEMYAELRKHGFAPETWEFNELRIYCELEKWSDIYFNEHPDLIGGKRLEKIIESFPKRALTITQFSNTLKKYPSIRFYLYSGDLDIFVPKETFEDETVALGARIIYRHFPSGHEGFAHEKLIWDDLVSD